jgi:hypothetical protein
MTGTMAELAYRFLIVLALMRLRLSNKVNL